MNLGFVRKIWKRGSIDFKVRSSLYKSAYINISIVVGTYVSGVHISKTDQLCSKVGLIRPAKSNMKDTHENLIKITIN